MAVPETGVKRSFATVALEWNEDIFDRRSKGRPSAVILSQSAPNSRVTSRANSPLRTASPVPAELRFDSDASVVLAGLRGAGKSTLAVIASTAMKRRVVESEQVFREITGSSSPAYKKSHSLSEYQTRQREVFQTIRSRHQKSAIIVCEWMERNVFGLLRDLGATNPIIHVVRDSRAIQNHLKVFDETRIQELLKASGSFFRGCTHFEFFNVSEALVRPGRAQPLSDPDDFDQRAPAPYLTLKAAERHFLKFLSLILPKGAIPFVESAFPLASLPLEVRAFTYATSIRLSSLVSADMNVEELETGADAIELVVDDLVKMEVGLEVNAEHLLPPAASLISQTLGRIRKKTVIPVFFHVVCPESALVQDSWRSLYLEYVQHGLRIASEYVSIDLRLEDSCITKISGLKGMSKLVGNVSWATSDPPNWSDPVWISYYRKAQLLGCNLVRFTSPAKHLDDNLEVSQVRDKTKGLGEPHLPLIAYNTGRKGRNSACFNKTLSSVLPGKPLSRLAFEEDDVEFGYPQPTLTARQATQTLHASFVYDCMKLYVFGANVDYSLSPAMHNAAFEACGIPHHYRPHSTTSIGGIRDLVMDPYFGGASIGLPFKVEIISLTHTLSPHAKAIGAVNTLIPVRDLADDGSVPVDALLFQCRNQAGPVKALYGENTDWIGIRACLRRGLSPANAVRFSSCGLVIGAGGMARAAVYSMLQLGVRNIVVFNRTYARAESLVEHFAHLLASPDSPLLSPNLGGEASFGIIRSRDDPWPERFRLPTMVVSCIPTHSIGNDPDPNFTLPAQWLNSPTGGVVLELAYKTLNTPLLDQSRREAHRGWVTMDGLDLLPEQGFAQFELFTGRRAPRRLMRREVFRAFKDELGRSNLAQLQPRLDDIGEQEP